jgi:mono/diheme cytochrome c family protein
MPAAATPAVPVESGPAASGTHFSAEQADRGRDLFRATCTECHYSSEFSDSQFKFKWSRRSAGSLYQLIFTTMPETAPGSLSPEETVDLVSYILRMNGFEAGEGELAADRAVLDEIGLASIRN